jgi:uncharacterized membrane protein
MKNALHSILRSRPHLSFAVLLGLFVAVFLPATWSLLSRALCAWNVIVWTYLPSVMWMMARADHREVRRIAACQDERSSVILVTLVVAAVMSLVAISTELVSLHDLPEHARGLRYAYVVLTLLGSWFLVGVLFCFHYAHLYYNSHARQPLLLFAGGEQQPDYWDFLYFSFTIAVAAQTSDVCVQSSALRKLVLGQSVLSFFFNLLILGLFVNIAAALLNT